MEVIIDVIGWIGSLEIISAYLIISFEFGKKIHKKIYQGLNLSGSLFLIINTIYYGAYPSAFVNVVWLLIAAIALVNLSKVERIKSPDPRDLSEEI